MHTKDYVIGVIKEHFDVCHFGDPEIVVKSEYPLSLVIKGTWELMYDIDVSQWRASYIKGDVLSLGSYFELTQAICVILRDTAYMSVKEKE